MSRYDLPICVTMDMHPKPIALVVNDDPTQLFLASSILRRDGFEVRACRSAEEALDRLDRQGIVDVVVTDLYMPGIDGWRLCRLLRSSAYKLFHGIPILVVSATFAGADAEELTAQIGADGFLAAPYEPALLCRTARDLIGNVKITRLTKALIVEPDGDLTRLLTTALVSNGYATSHANNFDEANLQLDREPAQIAILDCDHAEVMAESLIDKIKIPGASAAVIVITSDPSIERVLSMIRRGADHCVQKPLTPEYLLHLCEAAQRQRALLRIEELLEQRTRKLRQSEERYHNLFESAGDGILIYDLDGLVAGINRALETLTGVAREQLLGKSYGTLLTGDSLVRASARQQQACTAKESSWIYELDLARAGGVVPVEAHCRFLPGRAGDPAMIIAVYRDISVKRQLENQRSEFLAMLAHDIRNPVSLILGSISLLVDEKHAMESAQIKRYQLGILENARLLQNLVNNYLDASTIEVGQLRLTKRPLDLRRLLGDLVQRYEREAEARSIRLNFFAQHCLTLEADTLAAGADHRQSSAKRVQIHPGGRRDYLARRML